LAFFGLILFFAVALRDSSDIELRRISAFEKVQRAIELTVEAGSRLHVSIGRGDLTSTKSASAFVGLSMLEKMTRSASTGDSPAIATTGDPVLSILAQDTLRSVCRDKGQIDEFKSTSAQLLGLTPFSYAAGGLDVVGDKSSTSNILIGSYGVEVALLTDRSERSGNLTLAGTDDLAGQAVLYATADEPLIGEELYAGGAYVDAGLMHIASLKAQDAVRWVLVLFIICGILLNVLGLDNFLTDIIGRWL
jgi:hypothetical protein